MHKLNSPVPNLFLAAIVGLVAYSCSSERAAEPGRYYNRACGFSVRFHAGWKVTEGDGADTPLVEATSPWEDDMDEFSEHVTVELEDLEREPELDAYFADLVAEQGDYLPEFRAVDAGELTIAGVDARWFIFEFTTDGYAMKAIGYAFIKDKRAYLVAGIAQAEKFMFYEGVFDQTARSFRFE